MQATGSWYQAWLLKAMGAKVEGPVAVAPGTSFLGSRNLKLGRYVTIGASSRIVSWAPVTIGHDFMASDFLNINSGSHDPITLKPHCEPIIIGERVWCGTGVTICAGVEIGDDVVIGAGSVVTKSLPSNCIAYGTPAKAARQLNREDPNVWSMWPERSSFSHYKGAPEWKRRVIRLRARL
ncbi:MAG TPA: acyltransferase [Chthoniobacterales bacterium]